MQASIFVFSRRIRDLQPILKDQKGDFRPNPKRNKNGKRRFSDHFGPRSRNVHNESGGGVSTILMGWLSTGGFSEWLQVWSWKALVRMYSSLHGWSVLASSPPTLTLPSHITNKYPFVACRAAEVKSHHITSNSGPDARPRLCLAMSLSACIQKQPDKCYKFKMWWNCFFRAHTQAEPVESWFKTWCVWDESFCVCLLACVVTNIWNEKSKQAGCAMPWET